MQIRPSRAQRGICMETAKNWSQTNLDAGTTKRRLLWHGILIFLFGLLAGMAVPLVANPRMGMAAHVGGVMSGTFLLLVGLIWDDVKLSPAATRTALWLFLYSSHTGWLAQFLAACWGTSEATHGGNGNT